MGIKVKVKVSIRVDKAKIEFKEGLGIGVLASQEMTFNLPKKYSNALLAASIRDAGEALMRDVVKIDVEEIK